MMGRKNVWVFIHCLAVLQESLLWNAERGWLGVGKVTLRRAIHLSDTDNSKKMYCNLTYKVPKWMPERWCSLWQLKLQCNCDSRAWDQGRSRGHPFTAWNLSVKRHKYVLSADYPVERVAFPAVCPSKQVPFTGWYVQRRIWCKNGSWPGTGSEGSILEKSRVLFHAFL